MINEKDKEGNLNRTEIYINPLTKRNTITTIKLKAGKKPKMTCF